MQPPRKIERVKNGTKGYTFELPYRVSKGRPDQDSKKEICTTYDVVFHPEVISMAMLYQGDFLKFVCDTAVDGVNKVVAQDNEKISQDYKMMKNLRCKGGQPASITIKVESKNPIINAMDPSKHETPLQKKLNSQSKKAKEEQNLNGIEENAEQEDEGDEEELQRIEGISEPKYKLVYSYPVDMGDCWDPPADILKDRKFPVSLRVTIQTPFMESIQNAELDINEDTLMFKVQETYDLMVTFKYLVDPDKGNARFEKDKKRMVIDLPIIGVTKATHEAMKKEKEQFEQNMKRITGQLVQSMDEYTQDVSQGFDTEFDLEKLNEEALGEKPKEEENSEFLKIYDESKVKNIDEEGPKILSEIKFKEDEDEDLPIIGINPINGGVELIKEIGTIENSQKELDEVKKELGIPEKLKEKEYEIIEAMFQQRDGLVFFMFKLANYDKNKVKYFVSSTHLYIEHDADHKLTKSYLEFQKEIDPYETKVEFVVGYICVTAKKDANINWKSPGKYLSGIQKFKEEDHELKGKHFKSNFVFPPKAEKPVKDDSDKENVNSPNEEEQQKTEENEEQSQIDPLAMLKQNARTVSHIKFSNPLIFEIF
jgi:hypothetical protein